MQILILFSHKWSFLWDMAEVENRDLLVWLSRKQNYLLKIKPDSVWPGGTKLNKAQAVAVGLMCKVSSKL